jgi:hypothetical protein
MSRRQQAQLQAVPSDSNIKTRGNRCTNQESVNYGTTVRMP